MIQGVLFDMDGVLFDTERLSRRLLPQTSKERGYPMSDELFMSLLGTTSALSKQLLTAALGQDYPYDDIMDEHLRQCVDIAKQGLLPLKTGVAECMDGLKRRGIRCALATSTQRDVVQQYLSHTPALTNAFDIILCGGEVARSKPAPDIYLEAARRLHLTPDACLGVEDSLNGLKSLTAAGITSVMVPDLLPFSQAFHGVARYVIPDLTRLCPLIDRIALGARTRGTGNEGNEGNGGGSAPCTPG